MRRCSNWRKFSAASRQLFALNGFLIYLLVVSLAFVSYSENATASHAPASLHAVYLLGFDNNSAPDTSEDPVSFCDQYHSCSSPALIANQMTLPIALGTNYFADLTRHFTNWRSSPPYHPPKI
jgi:hypothetical protein